MGPLNSCNGCGRNIFIEYMIFISLRKKLFTDEKLDLITNLDNYFDFTNLINDHYPELVQMLKLSQCCTLEINSYIDCSHKIYI